MKALEGQTKAASLGVALAKDDHSRKALGPSRHILAVVRDRSNAKQHMNADSLPRRSRVPHDGVMSILGKRGVIL